MVMGAAAARLAPATRARAPMPAAVKRRLNFRISASTRKDGHPPAALFERQGNDNTSVRLAAVHTGCLDFAPQPGKGKLDFRRERSAPSYRTRGCITRPI